MMRYVEQRLFEGGIPSKSTMFLVKEDFRLAGELMSMIITQDGQAPNFLASAVFKYLSDTLYVTAEFQMLVTEDFIWKFSFVSLLDHPFSW